MAEEGLEKRGCVRFRIPGATAAYKKEKSLFHRNPDYGGEFLPILDISRGGIRFLSNENIALDTKLHLRVQVPGDQSPLQIDGVVQPRTAPSDNANINDAKPIAASRLPA